MRDYNAESLSHDPIHGYIPFVSTTSLPAGETAEQEIIDHPWVQRLRQIHQLQTAWYVFPSAEHLPQGAVEALRRIALPDGGAAARRRARALRALF